MEIVAFIIIPGDPLVQFLFPSPTVSALLLQKSQFHAVELDVESATWPLWAPKATESTGKERI